MYKGGNRGGGFAPVKVGEELEVKIEAVGEKGDGIARKQGFVLFIPNTKQGDQVRIRVTKVLRKVGFAEVVDSKAVPSSEEANKEEANKEDAEDSEDFGEEDTELEEEDSAD
ncbi:MAG: TRAM domain-containing protein [Nanoarchaeota archaeon]